jgi:prevent-host-death family protein
MRDVREDRASPRAGHDRRGARSLCALRRIGNLVSMTRSAGESSNPQAWRLQDAKARFSELVRRVRSVGPQHVTVHGREAVVVVSAEEFRRLTGAATGQRLVDALQASPHREVDIEPERLEMPVRAVEL